jgi:soluble lytic murein transglycosylase-like protein
MHGFTKSLLFLAACTFSVCPAFSQTTQYAFDNFDAASGVRIRVEPKQPVKRGKKISLISKQIRPSDDPFVPRIGASQPDVSAPAMNMAVSKSLDGFTTGDSTIDGFIVESSARNNVDPVLIYSIMHQESTFKRNAISPKGARGLMQLMPGTAARFGVSNIFDPKQNIEGGTRYVRFLLDMFDGDVPLALAGYNAGEGAVLRYGRQVPPYRETQEYVRRIGNRYALMRDPSIAQKARTISSSQVASVQPARTAPLYIYERNVFAVRTPDGRLQLVSQ